MLILMPPSVSAQGTNTHYPFASQAESEEKRKTLETFIACYGTRRVNRIFVAPAKNDDGEVALYAYWPEGNSLLLIEHFIGGLDGIGYSWLNNKARINLKTDVVPTKEDVGGSTYLVDKPWVDRIVRTCLTKGLKLTIHKASHGVVNGCV